jgi:hypothetical protein
VGGGQDDPGVVRGAEGAEGHNLHSTHSAIGRAAILPSKSAFKPFLGGVFQIFAFQFKNLPWSDPRQLFFHRDFGLRPDPRYFAWHRRYRFVG